MTDNNGNTANDMQPKKRKPRSKNNKFSVVGTIGHELRMIRKGKSMLMEDVGKQAGVTSMYISEIERNLKTPSDDIIEKLADIYGVDAKKLYKGFSRVPENIIDEICDNKALFNFLYEITSNDSISISDKTEFYDSMYKAYMEKFKK